jgi:hypothetical protein
MRIFQSRSFLSFLTVIGVFLSSVGALEARPIKFPKEEPTFTLTLPEDWTSKADKDGNLDCDPGDDSGYYFGIVLLEGVTDKATLKELLPTVAKKMALGAKIKRLTLGDMETTKNENKVSFTGIRGDGKSEGVEWVIVLQGFEPQKGKFYAIMTIATKEVDEKHEKDFEAIYDSITPLEE